MSSSVISAVTSGWTLPSCGPAVNEVSRIASMCRSVDRPILVSAEFAAATPEPERSNLVSVGRYALRGLSRAQELFTIDPGSRHPPAPS